MEKTNKKLNTGKKSKSKYVAAGVAAAVAIVAIAFFATGNQNQTSPTTSGLTTAPQVGNSAPDFSLTDPQKGGITKQTFSGKPLVIYFMATWCSSCYVGVENLASYYDQSDKSFNVLLVSADGTDTSDKLVQFQKDYGRPNWYVASGVPDMVNKYQVKYLDTKYILDKDGMIQWTGPQILDPNSIGQVMSSVAGA